MPLTARRSNGDIMFSSRPFRATAMAVSKPATLVVSQHTEGRPAKMAVGQHIVRAGESIPVPVWTRPLAGEHIPVQNVIVRRAGKSTIYTVSQKTGQLRLM